MNRINSLHNLLLFERAAKSYGKKCYHAIILFYFHIQPIPFEHTIAPFIPLGPGAPCSPLQKRKTN